MNPWNFIFAIILLLLLLAVGLIACVIMLVKNKIKKHSNKAIAILIATDILLLLAVILYASSHSTYYKYNDWAILQSNIHMVEQKYGEFDLGEIKNNEKGIVAYYIYTDNGPIMPDHLEHYYYMEYDNHGIIYNVYDGAQPGG